MEPAGLRWPLRPVRTSWALDRTSLLNLEQVGTFWGPFAPRGHVLLVVFSTFGPFFSISSPSEPPFAPSSPVTLFGFCVGLETPFHLVAL